MSTITTETIRVGDIVELAQSLIKIPSQSQIDAAEPILTFTCDWLTRNQINWKILKNPPDENTGILASLDSGRPGESICLNACIDTPPAGPRDRWNVDPFEARVDRGWMYGRGAACSKVAAAIFLQLVRAARELGIVKSGKLHLLLDAEENEGEYGGVRALIDGATVPISFMAIGYAGNDSVVTGARGFLRGILRTSGVETHTGSKRANDRDNAIVKMVRFIDYVTDQKLPASPDSAFWFGPKINVTEILGGRGFNMAPGACEAKIDIRLTPQFDAAAARNLLTRSLQWLDRQLPGRRPSTFEETGTWPAYKLDDRNPFVESLRKCGEKAFGRDVGTSVGGPSTIANYLATRGIPASCGFGVTYQNQGAPNECAQIETALPVFNTYFTFVKQWLDTP